MPNDVEKVQIGLRLPTKVVDEIDTRRLGTTRAQFCRNLIEKALADLAASAASAAQDAARTAEIVEMALEPLREQLTEISRSSILVQRDAATTSEAIRELRTDLATAVVGILTTIGQAVRQEDKRPFAQRKAEEFVRRVLLSGGRNTTEDD
jgi:hypothetical protein